MAFWLSFILYSAIFGIAERMLTLPLTYLSLAMTAILAVVSSTLRAFK
ncbi:MAG: hypothetical protein QXI54_09725 [Archaeoglobaceae archaeon]